MVLDRLEIGYEVISISRLLTIVRIPGLFRVVPFGQRIDSSRFGSAVPTSYLSKAPYQCHHSDSLSSASKLGLRRRTGR
jgi:hypothetical protein